MRLGLEQLVFFHNLLFLKTNSSGEKDRGGLQLIPTRDRREMKKKGAGLDNMKRAMLFLLSPRFSVKEKDRHPLFL